MKRQDKKFYKEFGETVYISRKLQGLSLAKLGKLTGLTAASLCKLEKGKSAVLYHNVVNISKVLGILKENL